jgi:large subunit ribosomal protein L18
MTFATKYRRRREGKTNYHKRLKLLQSGQPRLVIRRSNTGMTVQFISYEPKGDKILAAASAKDVRTAGLTQTSGKSLPASYLAGYIAGKRALKAGVSQAIVDIGMHVSSKGNRLYAAVKGALDAGVQIPVSEDVLPSQDRVEGKHIAEHRNVKIDMKSLTAKIK